MANMIQLRPRPDTDYLSFDFGVLKTARDGFVYPERNDGLFMHRTRLLSSAQLLIDDNIAKGIIAGRT